MKLTSSPLNHSALNRITWSIHRRLESNSNARDLLYLPDLWTILYYYNLLSLHIDSQLSYLWFVLYHPPFHPFPYAQNLTKRGSVDCLHV